MIPVLAAWAVQAGAQATWVVDERPRLDVAGVSAAGSVTLGYPAGGTRLTDGRFLIADRAENAVRLLGADGALLRTIGRAGQGPGEFQSVLWAGRCGQDSLLVWDLRRREASIVSADGRVRQFPVPRGDTAQSPMQFSCSPNGEIVYQSTPRPLRGAANATPDVMAARAAVYRIDRAGAVLQRLGEIPAGEVVAMVGPTGGRGGAPRPLGRTAAVAALAGSVAISSADSPSVTMVRPDGREVRHVLPITTRAPSRSEYDEAIQALALMAPAALRQSLVDQLTQVPMPERLPAITALFVDTEGLLWVQASPPGAPALDFLIVDQAGAIVARCRVPRGITVFEIGRDYVLGSLIDASDEVRLVMFGLRRG